MAARKGPVTRPTDASVAGFLAGVPDERRREDAGRLCAMMQEITGEAAGDVGKQHRRFRRRTTTGTPAGTRATRRWPVSRPGASTWSSTWPVGSVTGTSRCWRAWARTRPAGRCLYVKRLDDVDPGALRELIDRSARVHGGIDRASS
jgi:hypothetical protein